MGQLEEYSRDLARRANKSYIMSGVSGQRAILPKGNVHVPESLWKVVVVRLEGDNDLERINEATTVLAVDRPNRQGIRDIDWQNYLTSVDQIEQETGYDLLSSINPDVQARIEAVVVEP